MQNVYTDLLEDMSYNKFIVGDLLFVEYTCPISEKIWQVWTQTDFIIHVISGVKKLSTASEEYRISAGDSLYIKKGSFYLNQYFDDEFCMFGFFINDDFIRETAQGLTGKIPLNPKANFEDFTLKRILTNPILDGFFKSMYPFFQHDIEPSGSLLELKLKELVINIITAIDNPDLSSYFQSLMETDKPSIKSIMESNFYQNLSIEEFASMSHRSLSAFKRDFKSCYSTSPGKWLMDKRLNHAQMLLQNKDYTISDVAFFSGFENPSHFSRSFSEKFKVSPSKFRNAI